MLATLNVFHGDAHHNSNGKHRRLIVFGDLDGESYTVREDFDGLPPASMRDIRRALNGWQRQHAKGTRLIFKGSFGPYWHNSYESLDHVFHAKGV